MTCLLKHANVACMLRLAFLRYVIVGVLANGMVLGIYFVFSVAVGFTPKLALALASAIAFGFSYAGNKLWSFGHRGGDIAPLVRYVICYLASFGLQWLILDIGNDFFGYPHGWVVVFGLGVATVFSFAAQRLWVFRMPAAT